MQRTVLTAAAAILVVAGAAPAVAQTPPASRVQAIRSSVVLEGPRGDSVRVGSIATGQALDVLGRQGQWLLVAPAGSDAAAVWERGWIHASSVRTAQPAAAAGPRGRRMHIRGFGQTGGTLFSARDSFDTILGSSFGRVLGGGGQVLLANGAFVQVAVERFDETGSRAVVSGNRVFTVDIPARLTVTPVLFSFGYRSPVHRRYAPYVGAGLGWHVLEEESATLSTSDTIRRGKPGYHVLGGAEFPLTPWASLAGEVLWAAVPDALGTSGVSAAFGEDDLGGASFRVKFILGY